MWIYPLLAAALLQSASTLMDGSSGYEFSDTVWRWTCDSGKCVKTMNDARSGDPPLGLEPCKMFCNEYGLLWPRPTGDVNLGGFFTKLNLNNINFHFKNGARSSSLLDAATKRFKSMVHHTVPEGINPRSTGKTLEVYLEIDKPDIREFSLSMDENYSLKIGLASSDVINATIRSPSFFGARHGLETLNQLIVYDEIRNQILIVRDVSISDGPVYPYRGVLLDTARNYFTVSSIKRTLDAMASVKLNSFHWHITDSQSFPFVSERRPQLSKLGAFSPRQVYTKEMIKDIVQYGLERGIRVIPEFDAPAHVGEGWQNTDLTVCFNAQPWFSYCVEPPCGQLNPTRDELYNVLEDIYADMSDTFQTDMFHMGGDEVSEGCWNTSAEIKDFMLKKNWGLEKEDFLKLWDHFQRNAEERVYKAFGKKLPLIMWTSTLTEFKHVEKYLSKDDYIIQVWTTGKDEQIMGLLKKGYKLIMSNYDALYFDCGFGSWVGSGDSWCSPYIPWRKVYDNSPAKIAGDYKHQILGGEAAIWSEQIDSAALDSRLWPRAAALAERLWLEPSAGWQDAEYRILHVRERLVRMGVDADSIEPLWCYQNEGNC